MKLTKLEEDFVLLIRDHEDAGRGTMRVVEILERLKITDREFENIVNTFWGKKLIGFYDFANGPLPVGIGDAIAEVGGLSDLIQLARRIEAEREASKKPDYVARIVEWAHSHRLIATLIVMILAATIMASLLASIATVYGVFSHKGQ